MLNKYFWTLLVGVNALFALSAAAKVGKMTFRVTDDSGKPIVGAEVVMSSYSHTARGELFGKVVNKGASGPTDKNGRVTLNLFSRDGEYNYAVRLQPGYYEDLGGTYFFKTSKDGKWQPSNPQIDIVFKPIVKPIPLYAHQVRGIVLPELGKPIGYDLVAADWVAPHGKGVHSDLLFNLTQTFTSETDFDLSLVITFSSPDDGIQKVIQPAYKGSALRLPRNAPEHGYQPKFVRNQRRSGYLVTEEEEGRDAFNYFFRVRSQRDKDGKIVNALYGKIQGDIYMGLVAKTGRVTFTYYLNPTADDRNLEFDLERNLFSKKAGFKKIYEP